MAYLYSALTGGFYNSQINMASTIPTDAITLTAASYAALLAGVNSGSSIVMVDGTPTLQAPVAPVPTVAQLQAYANAKVSSLLGNLRSYTVGGLSLKSDCTDSTISRLNALLTWGNANPTVSANWIDNDNGVTALTGLQFVMFALAVGAYGQMLYSIQLAAVLTAISGGSITTTAQIDAYAWTV